VVKTELSIRPHNNHGVEQVQFPDIGVNRGKETTEELITEELMPLRALIIH
jgi:hypothetical protein